MVLVVPACAEAPAAYLSDPSLALRPGTQSAIPAEQAAAILKEAGVTGRAGLKDASRLNQWLVDNFKSAPAGGAFVGKQTAAGLLETRVLTGCHDWGLMLSSLLRSAGYPAVMVDTAGAEWMAKARTGAPQNEFDGHVFVEAFISGSWVLLDSVSPRYLENYDPSSPLIPLEVGSQKSYVVMFKGVDPAGYGVGANNALGQEMIRFAKRTDAAGLRPQSGRVADLPSVGASLRPFSDEDLAKPTSVDPARLGVVLQFHRAELDAYATKEGGKYVARTYPYGYVFTKPLKTASFSSLGELKSYLRGLEPGAD